MNLRKENKTTRAGPDFGESRGVPDSRCIVPIVYGGGNLRNDVAGEVGKLGGTQRNEIVAVGRSRDRVAESTEVEMSVSVGGAGASEYRSRSGSEASASASDTGRFWQTGAKRPRLRAGEVTTDEDMAVALKPKGRGRPAKPKKLPNPGCFNKKTPEVTPQRSEEVSAAEDTEEANARAAVAAQYRREQGPSASSTSEAGQQLSGLTAAEINQKVLDEVDTITKVAATSSRLKGTYVRDLRDAAAIIKEAVVALSSRTISEETRQLQAKNVRLEVEVTELRREVASLRKLFEKNLRTGITPEANEALRPKSQQLRQKSSSGTEREEFHRSVMVQVGEMLNARLASYEDRLLPEKHLRPPLAADKKKSAPKVKGSVEPMAEDSPEPQPSGITFPPCLGEHVKPSVAVIITNI